MTVMRWSLIAYAKGIQWQGTLNSRRPSAHCNIFDRTSGVNTVMSRKTSLSGFHEWLPQERLVELHVLNTLAEVFELHGFSNIETRAVEPLGTLLGKGEIDKEVYTVSRIHETDATGPTDTSRLALHRDLTVHFGCSQADIDVIGDGTLDFRHGIDVALVMGEALAKLPIGEFVIRINNRKLAEGFYQGIGLSDTAGVLRNIDKLEKIGPEKVAEGLQEEVDATPEQAKLALALAQIRGNDSSFVEQVRALGVEHELLEEGLQELAEVIDQLDKRVPGTAAADLSIARGLDYYTGTVYETHLVGHEQLGSICSGGRYDALATKGKRTFPAVSLSIGVTRLISRIFSQNMVDSSRKVPTAVYVALTSDEDWSAAHDIAQKLRSRGIKTEVATAAEKFGKQIRHADRRGIPYVWFSN